MYPLVPDEQSARKCNVQLVEPDEGTVGLLVVHNPHRVPINDECNRIANGEDEPPVAFSGINHSDRLGSQVDED